jgi:hypothetical protein
VPEREPAGAHVAEGRGKFGFARQFAHGLVGPFGQRRGDRPGAKPAFSSAMIGGEAPDRLLARVDIAGGLLGFAITAHAQTTSQEPVQPTIPGMVEHDQPGWTGRSSPIF